MDVCPRCGTGNFQRGRSLSVHLSQYCQGPRLLFNGYSNSNECALVDGSNSVFCGITSNQQAQYFNTSCSDIPVPTINTLQALPPLSHLAPTVTDLQWSNVQYAAFQQYIGFEENAIDQLNPFDNLNSIDKPLIKKSSCVRNNFDYLQMLLFNLIVYLSYQGSYSAYTVKQFIITMIFGLYIS